LNGENYQFPSDEENDPQSDDEVYHENDAPHMYRPEEHEAPEDVFYNL
jgi:hypothetical protein